MFDDGAFLFPVRTSSSFNAICNFDRVLVRLVCLRKDLSQRKDEADQRGLGIASVGM